LQEREVAFDFDFIHVVNLKKFLAGVDDVVDMSLQVQEVVGRVHTVLGTKVAVVAPWSADHDLLIWGRDKAIGELGELFIELTVAGIFQQRVEMDIQ